MPPAYIQEVEDAIASLGGSDKVNVRRGSYVRTISSHRLSVSFYFITQTKTKIYKCIATCLGHDGTDQLICDATLVHDRLVRTCPCFIASGLNGIANRLNNIDSMHISETSVVVIFKGRDADANTRTALYFPRPPTACPQNALVARVIALEAEVAQLRALVSVPYASPAPLAPPAYAAESNAAP